MPTFFKYAVVADAVAEIRSNGGITTLQRYEPEPSASFNELLVFLKPELTDKYPDDRRTFDICSDGLTAFGCSCVGAVVLGSDHLAQNHLIEAHYGLINTYSVQGFSALPSDGQDRARDAFKESGNEGLRVLGAHQVLEAFPEVTSDDLLAWHDQATETYRLASGAYSFFHDLRGETILIIDGFHPAQIAQFYDTRNPIVAFVVRSTTQWETLRAKMCGATNPAKAAEGSIRRTLLERRAELDLDQFDSMRNGIHVSAGPIEAAVEIARYIGHDGSLGFANTSFGALVEERFGASAASALSRNEIITPSDGRPELAFDLTEHVNAAEALGRLEGAFT